MWFVFPQLDGLGRSPTARRYAIASAGHARAYAADPVLGPRLRESCEALLALPETTGAERVLGPVDAMKLRSCATLFARAADDVRERVGKMIAGVRVRDLERLTPRVLAGVLPRLYPQMLERAYAHQDAGEPVYILTAASQEMADLLAHVLAFDGGLGSRSEIVDGRYTGRPAGPFNYREGKVLSMREVADREGIDLRASYAYSDSESDLPMLRAVGHAVVVNPDSELRRIALREGWEMIELDRLGRRLKMLAALGAGTALASLGRAALDRGSSGQRGRRAASPRIRPIQSGALRRRSPPGRARGSRRGRARSVR